MAFQRPSRADVGGKDDPETKRAAIARFRGRRLLKDEQASQAAFRELQNSGHVRVDLPLESKSGAKREVEVVANRYDEDGTQVVQCNVRDITERKKTEGALRASEERFRTLFELGPSAVYACDSRGVIQDFNQRATELWGRTPARGDDSERFCGSIKMFRPDGSFMSHDQCPMAWWFPENIRWSIDGEAADARFRFQWQERDGPPVVAPTRKGFGSMLLERLASQDFGAQPTITFAPGGLSYSIDASLPTMTAGNERTNLLRSSDYSRS